MQLHEYRVGDIERLVRLVRREHNARQRDRFRMALLALRGREKLDIARTLGVAKSTVERWVYAYRDGGIDMLYRRKSPGATPKLTPAQCETFRARMLAGPRGDDGVCTLRGKDAVRILNAEFGVDYTLNGVYDLLHRLGLSCQTPRPRHEKNDPEAMEAFRRSAPLLSRT